MTQAIVVQGLEQRRGRLDRAPERPGKERITDGREVVTGQEHALIAKNVAEAFASVARRVDRRYAEGAAVDLDPGVEDTIEA
jgi:hypothetical protein